jgi:hypothetical protein
MIRLKRPNGLNADIDVDNSGNLRVSSSGMQVMTIYPKVGQYIQLKKTIPPVKAEPQYNFKGHPEIPEGAWVKVTGHKLDRNYMNIEYRGADGEIYNTTPLLYPDEYHILPATDDTEVARILYDNKD